MTVRAVKKTFYKCSDGLVFETKKEAVEHEGVMEKRIKSMKADKFLLALCNIKVPDSIMAEKDPVEFDNAITSDNPTHSTYWADLQQELNDCVHCGCLEDLDCAEDFIETVQKLAKLLGGINGIKKIIDYKL